MFEPTPLKVLIPQGTEKIGLLSSNAVCAVFNAPLFAGASTTIRASAIAAINLFLFRKENFCGGVSGKYSVIIAPPLSSIFLINLSLFDFSR